MKDWFARFEFLEDAEERRVGGEGGFRLRVHHRSSLRLLPARYRITLPGTMGWGASLSNCMVKANNRW